MATDAEPPAEAPALEAMVAAAPPPWEGLADVTGLPEPLSLDELLGEAKALNPTLAQADALVAAAAGRATQAGLYPNPTLGYEGDDIQLRNPGNGSHSLFWEQPIVLGRRLARGREAAQAEQAAAVFERDAQQLSVVNGVRSLFYRTLAVQAEVALRRALLETARAAVTTSEELFNVGQADRPDVLAIEVEAEQAAISLELAQQRWLRRWAMLAAATGQDIDRPRVLIGPLDEALPRFEVDFVDDLLARSPQMRAARARVERARAVAALAEAVRVPDLDLRTGLGYDFEDDTGWILSIEIGAPLPILDDNRGNIAAARAGVDIATAEAERTERLLRAEALAALAEYRVQQAAAQRYRETILPHAERAWRLYVDKYREMHAAYPQVLIAWRRLIELRVAYLSLLAGLQEQAARLDGLLLADPLAAPGRAAVDATPTSAETAAPAGGH